MNDRARVFESSDADLPSVNNSIRGHAKHQPKRIYLRWATLPPILDQSKERSN